MILHWFQNPIIETFGWTLLHSLWQLGAIAAATMILLDFLRRASASARYVLLCASLLLMVLSPVITFVLLQSPATHALAPQPISAVGTPSPQLPLPTGALPASPVTFTSPVTIAAPTPMTRLQLLLPYAVLAYFIGTLLFSVRLLRGYLHLRRLRTFTSPLDPDFPSNFTELVSRLRISRTVQLLRSSLIEVPTVVGYLKPVILLPATSLTGLSANQLSAIVAHELAHIRRHDFLANLLQSVIETLLFYHPAVWWLSSRIRLEREHCCDDLALSVSSRTAYAAALTQMESLRTPSPLSPAANSAKLLPRIRRILAQPRPPRRNIAGITLMAVLVPACILVTIIYLTACHTGAVSETTSVQKPLHPGDYSDLSVYPTDWIELTGNRLDDPSDFNSPANRAVREHLEENVKEIAAEKMGFEKVINLLRDNTGTNIFVNWTALQAAGVDHNSPVTVNLRNVPFRKVLVTVLAEVAGGGAQLGYSIDDGVITISTKDDLESAKYQVVRVFDIRDMLIQPESVDPPFGNSSKTPAATVPKSVARDEIVHTIMDTIETTVAPDSWHDKGGKIGSIRELNGQLIVNQTVDNQKAINSLLKLLRESRAVQIAIEARLYFVDEATLKKLDLSSAKEKDASPNILNNEQLNKIIASLQASPAVTVIDTPRITLFNGQRGYIGMTEQQHYIATCNVKKDDHGKTQTEYELRELVTGLTLGIEATVSADRTFAVVKAHPAIRILDKLETFPAPDAPVGPEFIIQKPVLREAEMTTMSSIPDQNTLILAGIKLNGPVQIPGGNHAAPINVPEGRQLLILIRPKIIVQKEIPARATPEGLPNPNAEISLPESHPGKAKIPGDIENDTRIMDRAKSH